MRSKRIMAIIGIIFLTIGLICISVCIFQQGNKALLAFGLMCNSIAFLLYCINRKKGVSPKVCWRI
ncbi:hypothetical protein C823_000253 [Eubacterium plexicaudatum ASF492]|nr:hypothetical protein C823_000253 [Eubacterium plexicaudatum ASF492]